jgi:ubiquinone/menaquinone biosynthesis C-methylase UbiE
MSDTTASYATANRTAAATPDSAQRSGSPHRLCPWYLGYFLLSPLRGLAEHPERLLGPLVRPGMTVLEPGCGMGYFSLPLARLVGPSGRVICVDLQPQMIARLRRRAGRAGLLDRIETVVCGADDLGTAAWAGRVDLAVAIHVVHEIPDAGAFFRQIHAALRPGGTLLVIEPKGHVSPAEFQETIATAEADGFARASDLVAPKALRVLLRKPESSER